MSTAPQLSIVIPTFNRSGLLRDAIESALAQTIPCEVVVVDHGSSDDTPACVKAYGDKVVYVRRETDDGPCIAWFDGVLRSRGLFVHLNFDDDWIAPSFAEATLACFSDDVGVVFTNARIVSTAVEGSPHTRFKGDPSDGKFLFQPPQFQAGAQASQHLLRYLIEAQFTISPGCATLRRKDLLDALMVNPLFRSNTYHGAGPDLMIFLAALTRYPRYHFLAQPLAFFRAHDASITTNALQDETRTTRIVATYDECFIWSDSPPTGFSVRGCMDPSPSS